MTKRLQQAVERAFAELAVLERGIPSDLLPHAELIRDTYKHLGELSNALTELERAKIRRKDRARA